MNTIRQDFNVSKVPDNFFEVIKNKGALLIPGFISPQTQEQIAEEVLACELRPVDKTSHTIPEQFDDIGWGFSDAPKQVRRLGNAICALTKADLPQWKINDIRCQLYKPGEVGIEWHRDYARNMRLIAVASFIGSAHFDIVLDDGPVTWRVQPGDLTLMRGTLVNGLKDDRPKHRVQAPETGQRLSIAYRQTASEKITLES